MTGEGELGEREGWVKNERKRKREGEKEKLEHWK